MAGAEQVEAVPSWAKVVATDGARVWVPVGFDGWGQVEQQGYLAQRLVFAAEARVLDYAFEAVARARTAGAADAEQVAVTTVGASMAMTPGRAGALVTAAVEVGERLPRIRALLRGGWIGSEAVRAIVEQTRLVCDAQIAELDRLLAAWLGPTRRRSHAPKIGPLKRMLGRMILRADPVAAEAAARRDRADTDVTLDQAGRDRVVLAAMLPAEQGLEVMERIEQMARRAAASDERTLPQKRAAALLALTRGWDHLPDTDGNHPDDPHAQRAARQVVLYAFEPPPHDPQAPVELRGYGPVTRASTDHWEPTVRRRRVNLAELADRNRPAALRYAATEALRLFVQARDGTCIFPGCAVPAEDCDLDHTIPFDHDDPTRGGRTTSEDTAPICRCHHRVKTAGIWTYYRDHDGTYVWFHGPAHPHPDPGTRIRVEPTGPLAALATPVDPATVTRQKTAAETGHTSNTGTAGTAGPPRPDRRQRRDDDTRRRRTHAEHTLNHQGAPTPTDTTPTTQADNDAPPF